VIGKMEIIIRTVPTRTTVGIVDEKGRKLSPPAARGASIRHAYRLHHATDYATVLFPLPGISNDLEVVRLL
jgi:hypothetical protein